MPVSRGYLIFVDFGVRIDSAEAPGYPALHVLVEHVVIENPQKILLGNMTGSYGY